ncbi:MAG: immunoglobulin domain-containing protein, partial [Chthoniobacteraceae bacterium]
MTYDAQGNLIASVSSAAVAPPTIIAQPVGQLAQLGSLISFSVVAAGTAPLSFQWLFNGNPISTVTNPTAGTATLVLSSLAPGDFGAYSVTVSNSANSVTSAPAPLQLDSVGDGIPDSWKVANFGAGWASNPNSLASADPDADGFTNAEEYADGTDPNNAAAHFFRLTIASGNVAVQPAASRYAPGSVVTLTALPSGDQQFTSFSTQDVIANTAAVTSTANPLVLTLNTNYSVSAFYGALPLDRPAVVPSFTVNNYNARAEAFLTQTDGKLVVAGAFDAITGVAHSNIARFNTDGTLDASFNASTAGGGIVNVVQQADGKLLIAGYFSAINGVTRVSLARLNTDGSLDTTFTANCDNFARQVAYRASDGKIVVVGGFSHVNGVLSAGVVRLNADGSVDPAFAVGSGANSTAYAVVWQPDGNLVIGGDFTSFNGSTVSRLVRLTSTGSVDSTFTATADSTVFQIMRRPSDGDLWVAGGFGVIDDVTRRGLARLRASDGGFDASVNSGTGLVNGAVGTTGLVLQADGKVVIGGNFAGYNGSTQYGVARVNADGSLDAAYTPGGTGLDNQVVGVFLDGAGNTLLGGYFNFINGTPHLGLARLLAANGNLDVTFTTNASFYSQVYAVTTQPDGASLVGGPFNVVNGIYRSRVARLNPDGTLDTAFNAGLGCDNYVTSIAVGGDGKVVVGGGFTMVNGLPNLRVARFNADGSLDSTFQSAGDINNEVSTVAVQRDGKVLIGGYFTAARAVQRRYLARLKADGTLDSDFVPIADARVRAIVVQPDTKILVVGEFTNVNGVATGSIARLNSDGSLDNDFTLPLPNNLTGALALQPDG